MPSTLEVVAAIAGILALNVLLRASRWAVRRSRVISWAWRNSLSRPLGSRRGRARGDAREQPGRFVRCLARALAWHAQRPLRIQPFEGPEGVDAAAVSAALSAAMTRIASLRRSGVDTVTAPLSAGTATDAIAEGVKAAPAGGELAAALLRLGWWALARGELQLSGHVLAASAGGPGLTLTIASSSGGVIERLAIRACEFESAVGAGGRAQSHGNEADRLTALATAGAVWTHFTILEGEWHLREQDLAQSLQTLSWRSYALTRVGIESRDHQTLDVTRALYAKAVDADPSNMVAQFNLASTELKDELLDHVRAAGMARLELVHNQLDRAGACWPQEPQPTLEEPESEPANRRNIELLLDRDPLHYQVAYKRVAAKLNEDVRVEAAYEASSGWRAPFIDPQAWWLQPDPPRLSEDDPRSREGLQLQPDDLAEVGSHLLELELTLLVLDQAEKNEWTQAGSKPWTQLRDLLAGIEGPMLVLWAMVALRVWWPGGKPWEPRDLWDEEALEPSREDLVESVAQRSLTPGTAVAFACGCEVLYTSRSCFNLACWYADIERLGESLRELELSLEGGGTLARRRLCDPQLRRVYETLTQEWSKLRSRYVGSHEVLATTNGDRPSEPTSGVGPGSFGGA
jgi:hypothetical protein